MVGNQEGVGMLKLECPQGHPVGRILKDAPHQSVQFDPGAQVGPRRFWPDEDEQPNFSTRCRFCDKPVGDTTSTLQTKFASLLADASASAETATLSYVQAAASQRYRKSYSSGVAARRIRGDADPRGLSMMKSSGRFGDRG
ncbi:hypothetical protein MMAN_04800 [Mycobacterium mantenii]|uniref:Uncharacterized protein n=1 Tax=Mycobacterium mantenii TaxID=560555 RepID=A0ABM7JLH9_MYCNT|nr:hypothetical protein [Mycobacterium mantenii]BBY36346.1 hypothetical protein MMAN_04800 [Mycobacterium mantenii]